MSVYCPPRSCFNVMSAGDSNPCRPDVRQAVFELKYQFFAANKIDLFHAGAVLIQLFYASLASLFFIVW